MIKQKWQQLQPQEKQLVLITAVIVGVYLFWLLIWQPLNQNIESTSKKIAKEQELLTWVATQTARFEQSKQGTVFRGSLTAAVNQSAKQQGIVVSRMQPQQEMLQVWVEDIAFDKLLNWLSQLNQQGIQVVNIDIQQTDVPGVVQVKRLQLGK
jgi:general secretion pathway protein M